MAEDDIALCDGNILCIGSDNGSARIKPCADIVGFLYYINLIVKYLRSCAAFEQHVHRHGKSDEYKTNENNQKFE